MRLMSGTCSIWLTPPALPEGREMRPSQCPWSRWILIWLGSDAIAFLARSLKHQILLSLLILDFCVINEHQFFSVKFDAVENRYKRD